MAAINTVFRLTDNVTNTLNRINQGFKDARTNIITANQAVSLFNQTLNLLKNVASTVDDLTDSYYKQTEQETKLYTVMRERMDASKQEVNSVKELSKELQNIGIYNDQIILAAAQEAATFVTQKESIDVLLPALANLVAQQYGYSASAENARSAATRMGKVILGNVDGLSKLGYVFTESEKKILKTGTEMERVATLANIINANVGNMNEALAKTPQGQLMNTKNAIQDLKEEIGASFVNAQLLYYQMKLTFTRTIANAIKYIKDHAEEFSYAIVALSVATATYAGVLSAKLIPQLVKTAIAFATAHSTILLIIGVLSIAIGAMGLLGNTSGEVAGRISVVFTAVAVTIKNVFMGVFNILYDAFAVIYNIVADVMNSVVAVVNGIIKAVNWVGRLTGLIKEGGGIGELAYTERLDYRFGEGMTNYEDALPKAYQQGVEFGDKVSDFLKGLDDFSVDVPITASGAIAVEDKNLIDIASDYRELLSKRATQAFNLQYARPFAPSVTIERVDIRKEVDADNVLNRFTNALIDLGSSSLSVAN